MTAEIVAGIVALVLALVGGVVGWTRIGKHGEETVKRKRAEAERDAATRQNVEAARPPLSGAESVAALRRLHNRLRRNKRVP